MHLNFDSSSYNSLLQFFIIITKPFHESIPFHIPRFTHYPHYIYHSNNHLALCGLCAGFALCGLCAGSHRFPKISPLQKQTVPKCQKYSHFRTFIHVPWTQKPTQSCCLTISFLLKFHHRKHCYNQVSLTILSQVIAGQFISTHSKLALPPNVQLCFKQHQILKSDENALLTLLQHHVIKRHVHA